MSDQWKEILDIVRPLISALAIVLALITGWRALDHGEYQVAWWFMALFAILVIESAIRSCP